MLLLAGIDTLAGLEPRLVQAREIAVIGLLAGVKVDAVGSTIRVAVLLDVGNELDLLADVIGGAAKKRRVLDVERAHVLEERAGIELRDLPRGLAGAPRTLFHLVLAGVGVGGEMAHVGDVHDVRNVIAVPFQHPPEQVLEQESAEVADVLVVVNRRAAGVEPDRTGLECLEAAQAARIVVVELERGWHVRSHTKTAHKTKPLCRRLLGYARRLAMM